MALLGPAGIGKTTFAKKLSQHLNIPCICTGELIRKQVTNKTKLGIEYEQLISQGLLLPDEISTNITFNAIQNYKAFILDGYPRRLLSAQLWKQYKTNEINCVVHLSMDCDILVKKSINRLTCSNSNCNAVYNTTHIDNGVYKLLPLKPIKDNICDLCGSSLYQRSDDDVQVLLNRIKCHYEEIEPILEFYRRQDIPVIEFTVRNGIEDFDALLNSIEICL
eukprot:170066_1